MTARARVLVLAAAVVALAGCGGGDGGGGSSSTKPTPAQERAATSGPPADTRRAAPASVAAIRGWVNAERLTKLDRAAAFFSLPAIVLNGPQPLLLRTRTDVRQWNESLPCGAALLRAVDVRGWTVARFRLTDRSGGHCDGPGGTASTAFALRQGKIAMWIRVRDDVSPQRAAPPRPPDRDFLRDGRVGGRKLTPEKLGQNGPSI
jgi:hypothetical protein